MRPTLATSRVLFAVAVVVVAVGSAFIVRFGWQLTRLEVISGILALGALAGSFAVADPVPMTDAAIKRDEMLSQFAVFVAFLAFYAITAGSDVSPFNEQVRQAVAFIHGHTYIDAPQSFLEHAQIGPYSYALHPPLPAFLLMPFVAIWGMDTNQAMFSVLIGATNVALAWILLGRLEVKLNARIWLTLFFGCRTILWSETLFANTWTLPEMTAVTFELLALIELFGAARPLQVGVYAALSEVQPAGVEIGKGRCSLRGC